LFFFLFHFLVVDRRQIFERGVQPASVVEGLDGVEDGRARLGACAELAATEEVLGQPGEETLGDGVVVGGGASDRDLDVGVAAALAEEQRDVLGCYPWSE
jgi:hypothetical protein